MPSPVLRSRFCRSWYLKNYDELKHLNPNFPLLLRTHENCMPAVTTELEWTVDHVLQFMLQTGRFRDLNGSIAQDRVEAAKACSALALLYVGGIWLSSGYHAQ